MSEAHYSNEKLKEIIVELENKVNKTADILWVLANRQGHNKCWWNPEIIKELMNLYDIKSTASPNLPSREEFKEGCEKYQNEIYESFLKKV